MSHSQTGSSTRGGRRRQQILEVATLRFAETGYRGASLRDIAQQVGITHPGLLYHFGSKEELLMAVLSHIDDRGIRMVARSSTARGSLVSWLQLLATAPGHRGLVELHVTLSAEAVDVEHPAHAHFVDRHRRLLTEMAQVFGDLADAGELLRPHDDPRELAAEVLALVDGLLTHWLLQPHGVDMSEALRHFLNRLLTTPLPPISESITALDAARSNADPLDARAPSAAGSVPA